MYWLPTYQALTQAECRDLAAGKVPEWLADCARRMCEWSIASGPTDYVGLAAQDQQRRLRLEDERKK